MLEYKIEKLERKKNMRRFRNRTGLEVKYGIMDIKRIIKQPVSNLTPLGSDIHLKIEDLEDLEDFFKKEQGIVENREEEVNKDKDITEKLEKDLMTKIDEITKATQVRYFYKF